MTRTGPGDVGVPTCRRTVLDWPPRPGLARTNPAPATNRALAGVAVVSRPFAGTALPGSASFQPAHPRFARRSGRLWPSCPPWPQRAHTARPRTRHVRVSPRWHFRFTCTCSGGVQHQFMDAHLIPEGTFHA